MKTKKINYYVLNISGYEEYYPIWFVSNKSKQEFKKTIIDAIDENLSLLLKNNNYIDGHDLLEAIKPTMIKKGFKIILPDLEISLKGSCLYRVHKNTDTKAERPEAISDMAWDKILTHNEAIREFIHEESRVKYPQKIKNDQATNT